MRPTACTRAYRIISCALIPTHANLARGSVRHFHASSRQCDGVPNHYETLSIQPTATGKEIKTQFYALSKAYHPDLHPHDPNASKRFVQISEAYATLSSPEKRAVYDRDFTRAHQPAQRGSAYPSGSFSSASTPAGGRPASGLSRRRTQFRGPPESFYRSGGYGEKGEKRTEHASRPSHSWEGRANSASDDGSVGAGQGMPGTGPGGFAKGLENDVPHFDSQGHFQTHSTIERTRHKARRRIIRAEAESEGGSSALVGFATVSAMLGFGFMIAGTIKGQSTQSGISSEERS